LISLCNVTASIPHYSCCLVVHAAEHSLENTLVI